MEDEPVSGKHLHENFDKFFQKKLGKYESSNVIFAALKGMGAISSVGLEHLPYKQGVVGSNPTSPTTKAWTVVWAFLLRTTEASSCCKAIKSSDDQRE